MSELEQKGGGGQCCQVGKDNMFGPDMSSGISIRAFVVGNDGIQNGMPGKQPPSYSLVFCPLLRGNANDTVSHRGNAQSYPPGPCS